MNPRLPMISFVFLLLLLSTAGATEWDGALKIKTHDGDLRAQEVLAERCFSPIPIQGDL